MNAVVSAPRCPLHLRPSLDCELADEALLGWSVTILEETLPGWYHVHTDYGYTGYAPASALAVGDGNAARWAALDLRTVCRNVCSVRTAPKVQAPEVTQLLRGCYVAVHGQPDEGGWQKVSLPDGREGYTKASFLQALPIAPANEAELRRQVTENAMLFLGAHYLWGGKTALGLDCSGLAFISYRLAGITIWRDASIKEGYPIHAIDPGDMQAGDLMYFPGHVAMYLGNGRYIHSTGLSGSDGVVINSLDPADFDYRADLPAKLIAVGSLF